MAMEYPQATNLHSQAILWWPFTFDEYVTTMNGLDQVAAHEGVSVEILPFQAAPPEEFSSFLPTCYGLLFRVWFQEDVLSTFKTRLCDNTDQDDQVCSICLDDLYVGSVTALNCDHEFHSNCIRRWLVEGQNICPLCKAPAIR